MNLFWQSAKKYFNDEIEVFAKGWKEYRGCKIEHTCAEEYGIKIIEL